jgi:sporulation protein YlmC with PRC-barrel domain
LGVISAEGSLLNFGLRRRLDMFSKLMITTALSGLMIGAAVAQSTTAPADRPATPPAASQSAPADRPATPPAATPSAPAQDRAASTSSSAAGSAQFVNSQKPDQWLASNFKGTDVLGSDNEKIGDVSDILFDKSGKIEAFVISVGGFLGVGSKDVAMAPSAFQVVPGDKAKNESDKLKVSMNKDQLQKAANFEPYDPPRTTTGAAGAPGSRPASAPAQSR